VKLSCQRAPRGFTPRPGTPRRSAFLIHGSCLWRWTQPQSPMSVPPLTIVGTFRFSLTMQACCETLPCSDWRLKGRRYRSAITSQAYAGYIDTDVCAHVTQPNASPRQVVDRSLAGLESAVARILAVHGAVYVDQMTRADARHSTRNFQKFRQMHSQPPNSGPRHSSRKAWDRCTEQPGRRAKYQCPPPQWH
jgi:hypothetical protein